MHEDRVAEDANELWSDLVDLSGLRLEQIGDLPETVLAASLRRIMLEAEQQPSSYLQFQSNL